MTIRSLIWVACSVAVLGCCALGRAADPESKTEPAAKGEVHVKADAPAGEGHAGHVPDLGHANAGDGLSDAAEIRTDLAIYTFCVFLLLLAILGKFAWGPIVEGLERREKGIADNIAAAEEAAEEAKRLTAQYEARLASAADEVRALLDEGRRDAEHTKQTILEEAREAAAKERDRTLREIESAKRGALKDLADRSADLAISLAGHIVEAKLTPDEHAKLVRQAVQDFSATAASSN